MRTARSAAFARFVGDEDKAAAIWFFALAVGLATPCVLRRSAEHRKAPKTPVSLKLLLEAAPEVGQTAITMI